MSNTPVLVKNASDTYVNQNNSSKSFGTRARLQVRNEVNNNRQSLIYFVRPFPLGVRILSAKLQVYNAPPIAGTYVLQVNRAGNKWSANRVRYDNVPLPQGIAATLSRTDAVRNELWDVDVTTLMQAVADGSAFWYGFLLRTTTVGVTGFFHAADSDSGDKRPVLVVQWTTAPDQPDGLSPAGGRQVGIPKPTLTYNFTDPSGDDSIADQRVQIGSSEANVNAGVATWDSGMVPTTGPEMDLTQQTYAGLTAGTNQWWRVQVLDDDGNQSPWSDAVEMGYTVKATVTFTTPSDAFFYEGSPFVAWSATVQAQKAYQFYIAKTISPNEWIWDSGKFTDGVINSDVVPFKKIVDAGISYRLGLRIWDTVSREATPGDPVYKEITTDLTYNTDGTVANVTSLAAASDPTDPIIHLTWVRTSAPSHFQILKSDDGGITWLFYAEVAADEALVTGTNYAWDDVAVESYTAYIYKVIAVVANRGSTGASVSAQSRRLAPFLMRKDGTDSVCFINPERNRESMDIQEVHERMSGPPVLVTQMLGGYAGHVRGRFVDGQPTGRTAKGMKRSFNAMRRDSGQKMRLCLADETLTVVAYNMNIDTLVDTAGITYLAEFDWIQVDD